MDGTLIDLERLAPTLRQQGAAIVVDATQAAGILPIDVGRLGADYLVFPTYKWLLGPYTQAFLYVAPSRQDGTPLEQYGANRIDGTEPFTGRLGPPIASARRFDMGQRNNPVNLPMALAGMALLRSWDQPALIARLRSLTDSLACHAEASGSSRRRGRSEARTFWDCGRRRTWIRPRSWPPWPAAASTSPSVVANPHRRPRVQRRGGRRIVRVRPATRRRGSLGQSKGPDRIACRGRATQFGTRTELTTWITPLDCITFGIVISATPLLAPWR